LTKKKINKRKKGECSASPIQQAKLLVAISNGEMQATQERKFKSTSLEKRGFLKMNEVNFQKDVSVRVLSL